MSEMLSGADILCRALVDAGVEVIFGYPGGAIMPFYHALPDHPRLRHILVRHEQAAAHARSEEHTSELQSRLHLVCRLLLEKKKEEHDDNDETIRRWSRALNTLM